MKKQDSNKREMSERTLVLGLVMIVLSAGLLLLIGNQGRFEKRMLAKRHDMGVTAEMVDSDLECERKPGEMPELIDLNLERNETSNFVTGLTNTAPDASRGTAGSAIKELPNGNSTYTAPDASRGTAGVDMLCMSFLSKLHTQFGRRLPSGGTTSGSAIKELPNGNSTNTAPDGSRAVQFTVYLDAGHGGGQTGAYSWERDVQEKEINLKVVKELKKKLEELTCASIRVETSRTKDKDVSLKKRTEQMKKADFFISIHCNADLTRSTCGIETLYTKRKFKDGEMTISSKRMAEICQEELVQALKLDDRGIIKREDLYLLHHAKIPGVIVELGFMSNPGDMELLRNEKGRKKAAQGLCDSILRIFEETMKQEE